MTTEGNSRRGVAIRYFSTITPKDEGSVVFWTDAPERFTGDQLRGALIAKRVPITDHLPQAYDENIRGYCNLDSDLVMERPKDCGLFQVDVRFTPLHPIAATKKPEASAGPPLANPGPMALFAFGFTTMMLMVVENGLVEHSGLNLVAGYAMFHGGLVQLVVGFVEIRRNNLFGATAFTSYGAFWMGWSLTFILEGSGVASAAPYPAAKCAYLTVWGIFTALLFVQTLFINRCLQAIFSLLSATFFILAGGVYSPIAQKAGGYVGMLLVLTVFYTASAELYNDMGNIKLPLFHVHGAREEFGNAHAGRGEILTAEDPGGVIPLRARNRLPEDPYHTSNQNGKEVHLVSEV
mmetsp:Transcript_22572/g.62664  ORF Transcript_22572/g.62664 Transcript_22572/m.62664 type:complete len:350 (-) Transcript_22572:333-1382(-)|eukprot:CAMPEP_0117673994 /NCGR_PEP_ID=MMETSP0804-20121206/14788_1 /TAXON_ID=1074897 /ORGANISM="Tetraselmis astigmatica, Strain CCMP880" /LENGTH=349 /DNA_ID=CAMNT_0005482807 /DNA_START=249 /DNA_END=1298 /DNA_ORIENTATION=-